MLEVGGLPGIDVPGARLPTGGINATVTPVLTKTTTWEKVRALPIAGQVAIWASLGFILLLIAAGIVTLLSKDSPNKVTSGTGLDELTVHSTAVSTTTTSTVFVPASVVPATVIVPTTIPAETTTTSKATTTTLEVTTTLEPTTVPPTEAPTTVAPTIPPTTNAPTTVPVTVVPTTPPTAAPTTIAPTTIAPTTIAPTTIAVTTTTVAPDPNNSFCHDTHNDGLLGFDLLEASIHRIIDANQYVFVATGTGPTNGKNVTYTFTLGTNQYLVVGKTKADKSVEATVTDVVANSTQMLVGAVVSPTKVTLTVTDDQMASIVGSAFDWTITLNVDGTNVDDCVVLKFGTTNPPK